MELLPGVFPLLLSELRGVRLEGRPPSFERLSAHDPANVLKRSGLAELNPALIQSSPNVPDARSALVQFLGVTELVQRFLEMLGRDEVQLVCGFRLYLLPRLLETRVDVPRPSRSWDRDQRRHGHKPRERHTRHLSPPVWVRQDPWDEDSAAHKT